MYRQLYMGGGPGIASLNAGAPSIKYEGDIRPQMASSPDPMAELYNQFLELKRTGQIPQDMSFEKFKDLLREKAMANQPMMDQAMANQPMMDQAMANQPMMDQPMMANGGLMSLRQRYGLGSKFQKFKDKVLKVADPIVQLASVIPNPYQPYAQAYTGIRSAGVGGDYSGLQVGGYTPGAYGGQYGIDPYSNISGGGIGGGYNMDNIFRSNVDFRNPTTGKNVIDEYLIYGQNGNRNNPNFNKPSVGETRLQKIFEFLKNTLKNVGGAIYGNEPGKEGQNLIPTITAATLAKLSYDDQKKLREKIEKDFQNQRGEVDKFRKKLDDKESLRGYQTTNVPVTAKDVVRAATNMGGIMKSRRGYNLGSEASMNAIKAAGIEGLPLSRNSMDGGVDINYTETGGFVPPVVGKEKQDKINALLADNEFVMTADAVRGMGEGNVNLGAKRMYDVMKRLEKGGRV
jgi:hypothetical protein